MITLVFRTHLLLFRRAEQHILWPDALALSTLQPQAVVHDEFQFEHQGRTYAVMEVDAATPEPPGFSFLSLRGLFGALDEALFARIGRVAQLLEWNRSHRFCGRCGQATERQQALARICPACGHVSYPRISPAIMALVIRGQELLLARGPHFQPGIYSALAGFCEPGESLEQALRREVREEVGLEVENLRYFGSQSWPFPHSLMVAFTCQYAAGSLLLQPEEIEDARWFPSHALPALSPPISIARQLIDATVAALHTQRP